MKKIAVPLFLMLAACANKPAPKDVVFEFIDAVRGNDTTRVVQLLDIDAYIKLKMTEMSSADSAWVLSAYRDSTLQSLLADGEVRDRWVNWQIVVNKEILHGELADVEVSFVNKITRYQLYTLVQLRKQPDDTWRMVFFE